MRIKIALESIELAKTNQIDLRALEIQGELNSLIYALCIYLVLETKHTSSNYFEGVKLLDKLAERKELLRLNIFLGVLPTNTRT